MGNDRDDDDGGDDDGTVVDVDVILDLAFTNFRVSITPPYWVCSRQTN